MRDIYSNFFVFQVLASITVLTVELTPVIIDHSDISNVLKNIFMSIAITCQFCLYCLPAAEITEEVSIIQFNFFPLIYHSTFKRRKKLT